MAIIATRKFTRRTIAGNSVFRYKRAEICFYGLLDHFYDRPTRDGIENAKHVWFTIRDKYIHNSIKLILGEYYYRTDCGRVFNIGVDALLRRIQNGKQRPYLWVTVEYE